LRGDVSYFGDTHLEHLEHLCGFYRSFSFKCQCPRRLTILTMLDLWGARVAGARCNSTLTRAARARAPLLTDLGNLSTPRLRTAPCTSAARSSHHCVCQCRCHASHTKLAQRHSAAPLLTDLETLSTPHLRTAPCTCRALLTPLRLPRHMCHLASH